MAETKVVYRPVGRISKLEGPALQKLGGPDHTFCTILAKSWGGPGPPGPYPTYSPAIVYGLLKIKNALGFQTKVILDRVSRFLLVFLKRV